MHPSTHATATIGGLIAGGSGGVGSCACFARIAPHVSSEDNLLGPMIAPQSMDGFLTFLARYPKAQLIYRGDQSRWDKEPRPGLRIRLEPHHAPRPEGRPVDHLHSGRLAPGVYEEKIAAIRATFPGELIRHLEAKRMGGQLGFAGLTLVTFTTEARLDEIVARHEAMGCRVYNPHRYTLEEGGRQSTDAIQLNFKRLADPQVILNPGEMFASNAPN